MVANTRENHRPEGDPVFRLMPPILFAHRGGAGEVPESTKEAFRHAIDQNVDVLELDVQLSKARKIDVYLSDDTLARSQGPFPTLRPS